MERGAKVTDAERTSLSKLIDLLRSKGVIEFHDGPVHILLGPAPTGAPKAGRTEEERPHPADLVAQGADALGRSTPDAEAS